jgi:hypothetical protein
MGTQRRYWPTVLAGVVAMALLVACGGEDEPSNESIDTGIATTSPETPTTDSASPSSETPTPMPEPTPRPTTPPLDEETASPKPGSVTLVGVPHAGVEMNCWLLDDYLLLGGDRELIASGERLEITGQPMKGVATTCMQGTPFEVETIEPAPSS